jgi:hypothetical protein
VLAKGTLPGKLTADRAEVPALTMPRATVSHTSGRQRGDSGRPSGNSNSTRSRSATVRSTGQTASQAAQSPAGMEPGAVTSAYLLYWCPTSSTATRSPSAHSSQPTRLWCWREAISAPTVAKGSDSGTRPRLCCHGLPWAGALSASNQPPSTSSTTVRTHSDQAGHPVLRGFTSGSSRSFPLSGRFRDERLGTVTAADAASAASKLVI